MCDCSLDQVSLYDIPSCLISSFAQVYVDFCEGTISMQTFLNEDRIYYFVLLVVIAGLLYKVLSRHKHEEAYHPLWELDARWHS